ncbi:MAG: FecR domain-containing protein [Myxococcota bacterium]
MSEPTGHGEIDAALDLLKAKVASASAPSNLYANISDRLDATARRRSYRWLIVTAAVSVVVLVTGALGYRWSRMARDPSGFELVSASPDLRSIRQADGTVVVDSGRVWLRVTELRVNLTVTGPSRVRREPDGIRVALGAVDFDVAPRAGSRPLRVFVSHGIIEVIGTRFAVRQASGGGRVQLDSGMIRFVDERGQPTVLHTGESLAWPRETVPSVPQDVPPSLSPPVTSMAPKTAYGAKRPQQTSFVVQQQILGEIDALRMRRETDALIGRLTTWLAETTDEPFRERLSFELCDVLVQQPRAQARACTQIAEHLRRYPGGENTRQLLQTRALKCGEPESTQ